MTCWLFHLSLFIFLFCIPYITAREQVHYKVMIDLFSYSEADGLYRMSCRCSDELSFAEDDIPDDDTAQIIIQCPGCSLRYEVILDEQVDDPC